MKLRVRSYSTELSPQSGTYFKGWDFNLYTIGREPSPNPCEIVMNLELKSRKKLKKMIEEEKESYKFVLSRKQTANRVSGQSQT